jgi:hypothetical protein
VERVVLNALGDIIAASPPDIRAFGVFIVFRHGESPIGEVDRPLLMGCAEGFSQSSLLLG